MSPLQQVLLGLVAAINLSTFLAFGWDKRCAKTGARRVPEKRLWGLMAAGGWIGGWAGMSFFRHKTRKATFLAPAAGITLAWFVGLAGVARLASS